MKKTLIFILTASILAGCGLFSDPTEKTATQLITEARKEYQDEDYIEAIELFQKLKNWYPFSEHAKEAEIRIADSFFEMKKYEEAIRAYQTFERLHPLDPEAERSAFRVGEAYYKQILSIDRDQSFTKNALKNFIRFTQTYPGSELVKEAEKFSKKCISRIAESELYVGKFYFKQKEWIAAEKRFQNIVKLYPETDSATEARNFLKKIPAEIKEKEEKKEKS